MAASKINGKKEYCFLWLIENFDYCHHKNDEGLCSPEFLANCLNSTRWMLKLYPRGNTNECNGYISLYLYRGEKDEGPEEISLNCELSFLAADGSVLNSFNYGHIYKKNKGFGMSKCIPIDEVLLLKRAIYLPQGSLRVRCRIWKNEGDLQQVTKIHARTRIEIEDISFLHTIKEFKTLKPNQNNMALFQSPTKPGSFISTNVNITDCSCSQEKIIVEIILLSTKYILRKCKISILDASGLITKCGEADYSGNTRKDNFKIPLSFTKEAILKMKGKYLPDDKLTLLCQCLFSSSEEYTCNEKIIHDLPSTVLNHLDNDITSSAKNLSTNSSALDDFKTLYDDQFLTDVELKTKTKSFFAHKIVLCARSSVFKAMMSSDMKEKNSERIKIDDLDDETMQQLLSFLYCDKLDDLQWENATKLYYAADKYEIKTLKAMCSTFLQDNLKPSTASEVLLLADIHNDAGLKGVVEDFIEKHEEEVFGSDEWEKLIETNPQLVIKTMHLKYRRNKLN